MNKLALKFGKYFATGGATFVVEYAVFLILIYLLGSPPWLGQAVSYVIAIVMNFILLQYWAFHLQSKAKARSHFLKYILLIATNLPITTVILSELVHIGLAAFIAKIVVVAMAALWNYLLYDKVIFKDRFSPGDIA